MKLQLFYLVVANTLSNNLANLFSHFNSLHQLNVPQKTINSHIPILCINFLIFSIIYWKFAPISNSFQWLFTHFLYSILISLFSIYFSIISQFFLQISDFSIIFTEFFKKLIFHGFVTCSGLFGPKTRSADSLKRTSIEGHSKPKISPRKNSKFAKFSQKSYDTTKMCKIIIIFSIFSLLIFFIFISSRTQ